jgi:hypothetical protein
MLDFQSRRFNFPSRSGFIQTQEQTLDFPSSVRKAEAFLSGFNIGFTDEDHHIFRHEINAAVVRTLEDTVTVRVTFLLRDISGNINDCYDGFIDVVVVVDREPYSKPFWDKKRYSKSFRNEGLYLTLE